MMVPDYISKQIFEIRNLLNEVLREVQDDTFDYDEFQIFRSEKYREFLNKIKGIEFEKLIVEAKNLHLTKEVFSGILSNIENYQRFYLKKKSKIKAFNINRLYDVYLKIHFDKEIAILKNDISDVEDMNNPLPNWEKAKLIQEFEGNLRNIPEKRDRHIKTFDWFFINYYEKFNDEFQAIEKLTNDYFPEKTLETETDIFERNFINDLYRICEENQIFKKENLSFENFYLILNRREPKQKVFGSIIKKTVFSFPIKNLSKKIENKNQRANWLQFVCQQFGLSTKSVNSHGDNKDDSTELFLKLFHISRYTS